MDCPQCGAEVPSDDAFCGKCGYARRDHGPDRLDQSRIRVHEEPDPSSQPEPARSPSQQRVRKHTVLGMPGMPPGAATPPAGSPAPESAPASATPPPPPPTSLSSVRSGRARAPQKTMLGFKMYAVIRRYSARHSAPRFPGSARRRAIDRANQDGADPASRRRKQRAVRADDPESSHACPGSVRQRERIAAGDPATKKGTPGPCVARRSLGRVARLPLSDGEWLVRRQTTRCGATSVGRATHRSPSSVESAGPR